jgi:hypothetical protein
MTELDAWLTDLLTGRSPQAGETPTERLERIKKVLKDKVLESFRNGQRARRPRRKEEPSDSQK